MLDKFRDHLIEAQLLKDEKFTRLGFLIFGVVILLLIADIIYLNSIVISSREVQTTVRIPARELIATPITILPTSTPLDNKSTPIPVPSITTAASNIQTNFAVKEYFIPLGSGASKAGDWEDVAGVAATVDFSQYPNIKEIHFEVSVSVPTANQAVYVRLFNQTDKHPVWFSEVATNGNVTSYLTSQPLAYDTGTKVYQVQMKTQLQSSANLVQARIHITLQ